MRQRVSIARAFAVDPEILLCDEPFSALDEMTARDLRAEFVRLVRQSNKTAVFITHQLDEAMEIGDRVLVFHRPARIAYEARLDAATERRAPQTGAGRRSCRCCRSTRRRPRPSDADARRRLPRGRDAAGDRDDQSRCAEADRSCWCASPRSGCAAPTCTSCAASAGWRCSRWCSGTRPPAWSRPSAPTVKGIAVGDHVVLTFIPGCGRCRWCQQGLHHLCAEGPRITQGPQLDGTFRRHDRDGKDVGAFCMIGGFAERTVVDQASVLVDRQGHSARPRQPGGLRRAGRRRRRAQPRQGQAGRQRAGGGLSAATA